MKTKPGFCYEIFKNQAYWSLNDGSVGYNPCSFYDGFIDKNTTPEKSWYGPKHRDIIDMVSRGEKIPGCHRCYTEEAAGRCSRRQGSETNYTQYLKSPSIETMSGPEGLDYSVGNLCNLKCVICGPHNSSAWIPDWQKIYPGKDLSEYYYRQDKVFEIENLNFLKNLRNVHFHGGGEPLMSDAHVNLLKKIQQVKGLSDVRVFYNTNATQLVDQEILDIWEQCQQIELYFSIDDIGNRFEYQRTGAKWTDVISNISWFKENMPHNHLFNVNCVWSYLNLFYLDELVQWHREFLPTNRYGDTCNLIFQKAIGSFGINHLSSSTMQVLRQKFKNYPVLLGLLDDIKSDETPHQMFWQAIRRIDQVRNNDFKEVCPEWSPLL
jgi:hypothetical protein